MVPEYMTADQRFASRRPDVLVYQTEVLEEDLTIAGPIEVELHVSTTGTDADWVVKLIDVYPDDLPDPNPNPRGVRMGGYQQLVRGDVLRGKFRESFETAASRSSPSEPTVVQVHAAGHLPRLSSRPPAHGAGPKQLVPAVGSQSAEVRRHLHGRRNATFSPRCSASIAPPDERLESRC